MQENMFMTSSACNVYYKNVNSNCADEKSERSEGNTSRSSGDFRGSTDHGWECVKKRHRWSGGEREE